MRTAPVGVLEWTRGGSQCPRSGETHKAAGRASKPDDRPPPPEPGNLSPKARKPALSSPQVRPTGSGEGREVPRVAS